MRRCRPQVVVYKTQALVNKGSNVRLDLLALNTGLLNPCKTTVGNYVIGFNPVKGKTDCICPALITEAIFLGVTAFLYFIKNILYRAENQVFVCIVNVHKNSSNVL
jgi:hypothetical protein